MFDEDDMELMDLDQQLTEMDMYRFDCIDLTQELAQCVHVCTTVRLVVEIRERNNFFR